MARPDFICGYPFSVVRMVLIDISDGSYATNNNHYFEHTGLSMFQIRNLIFDLISEGYITTTQPDERREAHFPFNVNTTDKGYRLTTKKPGKRMTRPTIEKLLNTVLSRCKEISELPCFISDVSNVYVFGSYLNENEKDYGDLDLIVEFKDKASFVGSENVILTSDSNIIDIKSHFGGGRFFLDNISLRRKYLEELKNKGVISYRIPKMKQYTWRLWDSTALTHHIVRSNCRISIHDTYEILAVGVKTLLHVYSDDDGGIVTPVLVDVITKLNHDLS